MRNKLSKNVVDSLPLFFKTELVQVSSSVSRFCMFLPVFICVASLVIMCILCTCVYKLLMCVPTWNTCSALVLAGPEGMEQQQPRLCWPTRFSSSKQIYLIYSSSRQNYLQSLNHENMRTRTNSSFFHLLAVIKLKKMVSANQTSKHYFD